MLTFTWQNKTVCSNDAATQKKRMNRKSGYCGLYITVWNKKQILFKTDNSTIIHLEKKQVMYQADKEHTLSSPRLVR